MCQTKVRIPQRLLTLYPHPGDVLLYACILQIFWYALQTYRMIRKGQA